MCIITLRLRFNLLPQPGVSVPHPTGRSDDPRRVVCPADDAGSARGLSAALPRGSVWGGAYAGSQMVLTLADSSAHQLAKIRLVRIVLNNRGPTRTTRSRCTFTPP